MTAEGKHSAPHLYVCERGHELDWREPLTLCPEPCAAPLRPVDPSLLGEHQRPDGSLCPYFVQRPYCRKCGAGTASTPSTDLTLGARDPREVDAARSVRLESALRNLVDLHDGPRDETYERDKPLAWAAAKEALDG